MFKQGIAWLFAQPHSPIGGWRIIAWWELRRIPYNLFIAVYGIICLVVFYWGIIGCDILQPGEDAVEPMALIIAPFVANVCYTLGWFVELLARLVFPSLSPAFEPRLLRLGLGFSVLLISMPAVYFGGLRVLRWILH